uniref:Uncharacterized protein n=1 Tax=Setaria viridis TaxID=4556 RepID=A0A4U6TTR4_SETVI|nr:hypothetical protein SEVIR_7G220250v2 [Setaria viridis]
MHKSCRDIVLAAGVEVPCQDPLLSYLAKLGHPLCLPQFLIATLAFSITATSASRLR